MTSPTPSPISDQAAGEQPCGQRDYCGRFPFCGCGAPDPVFRERDMSKPAEQQGLFRKFDVRRVDGSDQEGGKHYGCRHFVLDMDHDAHAPAALIAYADSCAESHPELAAQLRREFCRSTAPTTGSAPVEAPEEEYSQMYDEPNIEAVIACLGDDAAKLREDDAYVEMADNMDEAARLLTASSIAPPANAPVASVLTEVIDRHLDRLDKGREHSNIACAQYSAVRSLANELRAILAASMGGDKS